MKQQPQQTINKPNPTQVFHPPPAVRRAIAIVAVAAIALVPTTVLVNRIVARNAATAHTDNAEQFADATGAREVTYAATPVSPTPTTQSITTTCGLICDPDMGALWNQVVSAADSDARAAIIAEAIRKTLRAIDDAVVAAAPAIP